MLPVLSDPIVYLPFLFVHGIFVIFHVFFCCVCLFVISGLCFLYWCSFLLPFEAWLSWLDFAQTLELIEKLENSLELKLNKSHLRIV